MGLYESGCAMSQNACWVSNYVMLFDCANCKSKSCKSFACVWGLTHPARHINRFTPLFAFFFCNYFLFPLKAPPPSRRQNRSVTSGKGLALRVGCIGPRPETSGLGRNCSGETRCGSGSDLGADGLGCPRASGARLTTDLELVRTRGI